MERSNTRVKKIFKSQAWTMAARMENVKDMVLCIYSDTF
jgi:hypothetical protein